MESISQAVERPPQSQIEGVPSDESRQFIAKSSGGPGGSKSGHQRKRGFRQRYWRSVQRGQNPSLVGQSGSKGRSQRCLESCTNFCQRLISFLASMVTWAQLKTIAVMIELLTLARTTFYHCKGTVTWTQMKTIAVMIQLLTFARTTFCRCKRMVIWAQLKTLAVMIQFFTFARTTFWHCKAMVARVQLNVLALLAILIPFARTAFRLFKVFFLQFCTSSYDITSDFLQGKQSFYTYIAFSFDASCSNQP